MSLASLEAELAELRAAHAKQAARIRQLEQAISAAQPLTTSPLPAGSITKLTKSQIERYGRQMILPEIGSSGSQQRLRGRTLMSSPFFLHESIARWLELVPKPRLIHD
jgi:hypothetical protein